MTSQSGGNITTAHSQAFGEVCATYCFDLHFTTMLQDCDHKKDCGSKEILATIIQALRFPQHKVFSTQSEINKENCNNMFIRLE